MIIPRIKFVFDRRKTATAKKKGSVELRVTFGKRQKFAATGIMLFPRQWDAVNECVKNSLEAPELNRMLQTIRQRAVKAVADGVEAGSIDLAAAVGRSVSVKTEKTFIEYVAERICEKNAREGSTEKWKSFLSALSAWGGIVQFSDITVAGVRRMDEWLHGRRLKSGAPLKQSTIFNYHKMLKQFANDAVADGYLAENPYTRHRIRIDRGLAEHVDCLTAEQLAAVRAMDIAPGSYLDRTRDLFLFQCFTGLSYSDLMKFRADGEAETITAGRTKTGSEFTISLIGPARDILAKYGGSLPKISNQKYNVYLKAIGAAVGAPKLHSHTGRGTFATMMLNYGVPVAVLQRMLGHKDGKQTLRYATMMENTVAEAFREVEKRMGEADSFRQKL